MKRGFARSMAAGLTGVALSACGLIGGAAADYPHLYAGDDARAGVIYDDVAPNQSTTVSDLVVCVDRPGKVEVTRVESREAFGGLELEQFAAMPTHEARASGFGEGHKAITEYGAQITKPLVLNGRCPDPDKPDDSPITRYYSLLLQYARPGTQTAGNHGIVIWYTSAGREHSLFVEWEVLLCDKSDTTTEDCPASGAAVAG
ncbi:hypothetical protein [Micromonospora sp. NPDC093277]|uniref:hypothetical protein n=1 Tax=Micromonospora sp. NPDC093277 TaxID=3364291 RepID=UPI0038046827